VQGTVKDFDQSTRTGSVLTDDRREVVIEPDSLDGELLMLRLGQRVRFELAEAEGHAVARALRVVTFD
jgi:cold shock CspA family protein